MLTLRRPKPAPRRPRMAHHFVEHGTHSSRRTGCLAAGAMLSASLTKGWRIIVDRSPQSDVAGVIISLDNRKITKSGREKNRCKFTYCRAVFDQKQRIISAHFQPNLRIKRRPADCVAIKVVLMVDCCYIGHVLSQFVCSLKESE